ncbi:HAD hydrolase-like protein [Candidatus Woesearchaeota archaeon]|nr:HAD hydrolase-like protein [Candidatus Woesearchaeota archaeon]
MGRYELIRLPDIKIKAGLFDVDDVLAMSESIHAQEAVIFFRKYGLDLTEEDHQHYYMTEHGGGTFGILHDYFAGRHGLCRQLINQSKDRIFVEQLIHLAEENQGASGLLDHMSSKGLPLAYVTSNYRMSTVRMLESLGMHRMIPVGVDHEYILDRGLKKKPHADPWIQGAKVLSEHYDINVRAGDCIGIEDTDKGALSMKRAGVGYRVVLLPDFDDMARFSGEAQPDLFVETLDTLIELDKELNLF